MPPPAFRHTPGPWKLVLSEDTSKISIATLGETSVCTLAENCGVADAKLILAAPRLLEFLLKHQDALGRFFEGLEGSYSDSKRELDDILKAALGSD